MIESQHKQLSASAAEQALFSWTSAAGAYICQFVRVSDLLLARRRPDCHVHALTSAHRPTLCNPARCCMHRVQLL